MRDYADTAVKLRERAKTVSNSYDVDPYNAEKTAILMDDAADAIEELLAEKAKIENSGKLLAAAFERLKSKVPRWISVEERLPEKSKIVLVAYDNGVVAQGMLFFGKFRGANFGFDENDEPIIAEVTHWMPLPEPPKGVE